MIRLSLDLGIEAVGLHLGNHTGEPDQIRVLFVVGGDELGPDLDAAFQVGKTFDLQRCSLLRCYSCHSRDGSASSPRPSSGPVILT